MNVIKNTLLSVLLASSFGVCAETLSQASVQDFMSKVGEAVAEQDAKLVASYLAEDAKISLTMPAEMGGDLSLNKLEYQAMLSETWAMVDSASYQVQSMDIKVAPDNKSAQVSDTTRETLTIGEQTFSATSIGLTHVVMQEGKHVIKSMAGTVEP